MIYGKYGDGISDINEYQQGLDPTINTQNVNYDDRDNVDDGWETSLYKDMSSLNDIGDYDADGLSDYLEYLDDTDFDGLPNTWEMLYFNNLNQGPSDDPDHDEASNLEEWLRGTNPNRYDLPAWFVPVITNIIQ